MDKHELYLYRIMMGYFLCKVEGQEYKIINPAPHILYKAEQIYHTHKSANVYAEWNTDQLNKHILVKNGVLDKDIDNNFKIINKRVEDLKIDLYNSAFYISFLNE